MTNQIPNNEVRAAFVSVNGDDDKTGESNTFAFATLGKAKDRIDNLTPPPSIFNQASIVALSSGVFQEQLEIPDFVQVQTSGVTVFSTETDYTVKAASFSLFEFLSCTNQGGGAAILIDGKSSSGLNGSFASAENGGWAVDVKGDSEDVFIDINQMRTTSAGALRVNTTTNDTAIVVNTDEISLDQNNDVALDITIGPGGFSGRVGNIFSASGITGTEVVFRGGMVNLQGDRMKVGTVTIMSGAEVWLNDYLIDGDIVVEAGGILHCRIYQDPSGTITNNGVINGNINGVNYGSFVQPDGKYITMENNDAFGTSFELLGYSDIDTTTDIIDFITAYYSQNTGASRTANFRIIDAQDSTVYYEGSNTDTVAEPKRFNISLTPVNPLPVNQIVFIAVEYSRTGFGFFSLSDPSIKIGVQKP